MAKSIFGTDPDQVPRNGDLGRCAYLNPDDLILPYMHVRDEKASGTQGGDSVGSAYNDRTLNTVVANTIPAASLSSNQVTLPAGTYDFEAVANVYGSGGNSARLFLYNVTDSVNIAQGENSGAESDTGLSVCSGRFSINAQKTIKLRQWFANTATNGLGVAMSQAGVVEIYASLKLWKAT